jgi:ATP-dependent Clp protease adapter protein ClpS
MVMTSQPTTRTPPRPVDSETATGGWKTLLFNDDWHTFDQVARQSVKAIGCTLERGYIIASVVHTTGSAVVWEGGREKCEQVARVYEEIRLKTKVEKV